MDSYPDTVKAILACRGDDTAPIATYPIPQSDVEAAEKIIGRTFPAALKDVWADIGGGFFHGPLTGGDPLEAISCLMGPLDVADIMRNRGWTGPKNAQFPFFNEDDEDFILLVEAADGYTLEHEHGRGASLAPDLKEFVRRLAENPAYWIDLLPSP
jgi:hypothetical protein